MKKPQGRKISDEEKMTLKGLIANKDYTQEEFAEKIGVSRSMLACYFTRQKIPGVDKAIKMAEVLEVSLKQLLTSMGFDVSNIPDD